MGADIHVYLEKKSTINGESRWVNIDYWQLNPYYDGTNKDEGEYTHIPVYYSRNYELFSILAGVRGYQSDMIEEPRGAPPDISLSTKKEYEKWLSDAHSISYFTLFELKEFLGNNLMTKCEGFVKPEDAKKIDKYGILPTEEVFCEDEQPDWVHREWNKLSPLNDFVNKIDERFKNEFFIFNNERCPDKEKLIRVVFWFDN